MAAVKNVDFLVGKGEIVGLIGPNGSGKTTLFNLINGIYRPAAGKIKFKGREITSLKPHEICKLGIARVFQTALVFPNMASLNNVMVGASYGRDKSMGLEDARQVALNWLEFVGLLNKKDVLAKNLLLHDKRMVEVSAALATNPQIMLLDEAVAGLNPIEASHVVKLIRRIRDELGITVFWIEHVMRAVMGTAERIIVLHHGEKIAEGTPEEISRDEKVITAYLGEKQPP